MGTRKRRNLLKPGFKKVAKASLISCRKMRPKLCRQLTQRLLNRWQKKIDKKSSGFKINNEGKLIINEDSDEDERVNRKRPSEDIGDSDSEEETFDTIVNKKRKVGNSETGSTKTGKSNTSGITAKSAFSSKYNAGGSGIHRKLGGKDGQEPGSEYRSKSGKGDVKRAGKADPYAYIPMSHKALNKRKAAKAKGQFSSVVGAAQKGAKKGNKARVRDVKHLMKKMKV